MKRRPFRMFLHQIGHALGEVDVNKIADLPMPMLNDWRDYFEIVNGGRGDRVVSPSLAQKIFAKRFSRG